MVGPHPFWAPDNYFIFNTKFLYKFEFNFLQFPFLCGRKTTLSIIFQWKSAKGVDFSASCFSKLCPILVRACMRNSLSCFQLFSLSRGNRNFEQREPALLPSSFASFELQEKMLYYLNKYCKTEIFKQDNFPCSFGFL